VSIAARALDMCQLRFHSTKVISICLCHYEWKKHTLGLCHKFKCEKHQY